MYIMSALLSEICKNTEWVWEGSSYVWRNTKVFQYIILVWPHYWSHTTNRELHFHSNAWWTWHKIWVALNFKFKRRDFYKRITTTVERPKTHKKRLNLTPVKHGYTLERHPMKKQKGSKPTKDPPRELKISVRDKATEDLSFEQSPEIK